MAEDNLMLVRVELTQEEKEAKLQANFDAQLERANAWVYQQMLAAFEGRTVASFYAVVGDGEEQAFTGRFGPR